MLLIYIDESGISREKVGGFWKDGPYIIWSCILIPENKYFHVERLFYELAKKLLNIKNWQKEELHANEIWNQGIKGKRKMDDVKKYFDELFQLISKLNLNIVFGIQQKNDNPCNDKEISNENNKAIFSFLHGIEYRLSDMEETGILIADGSKEKERNVNISYNDFEKMVFSRLQWRYNPGAIKEIIIESKYEFETNSCFILDQLHYADSKDSLFIQLSDHIAFVLQRVFTFKYLQNFHLAGVPADIAKVPVSSDTFITFVQNTKLLMAFYDEKIKDIRFTELKYNAQYIDGTPGTVYLNIDLKDFTPFQ